MRTPLILRAGTWLVCVFALVLAACDQGTVVGPDQPAAPSGELRTSEIPKSFILPIGTDLGPIGAPSGNHPLAFAKTSSATSLVYDAVPEPFPGSYPSLGFQATSADEFGDLVALTRPGVAATVAVGMNSWACENDDSRADDEACMSSEGSSYMHPLTLNIYQVDYSGTTPAVGPLIASVTETFEIPFRPSWDSDKCTASGETPATNDPFGGKWYDPVLDACVNGFAFTATFDLSGLDVVLPPEVIYGVAFNTQTHGESPIGVSGPYNSLNVGVANLSTGSLGQPTIGSDVEPDALFWDTSFGDFYCDGGAAGVDIFRRDGPSVSFPNCWGGLTPIIAMSVTNEGHVTGGGWFTSPEGAYKPATTSFGGLDWGFAQETGDPADASGALVSGPGTPPAGSGSAQLVVSDAAAGIIWGAAHDPLRFDRITELGYSSYRTSGSSAALAVALQFNVDYDLTDADESWQGRLVFEPYLDGSTVVTGSWQTWDATTGARWWSTGSPGSGLCTQASPCTWSEVLAAFPDAGIHPASGAVLFKAGSGWGSFDGNVDAFRLGIDGTTTEFDFEPGTEAVGRASFGFISRYKKGADVPTGNTQFTFKAGDLNFLSTAYDWLVVNQGGSNAQFKGTGTINNMPSPTGDDYGFMIWAGDDDPDTFRIKIWYEQGGTEQVVYDNGFDQPIEGGQIVVHDGKGK